MQTDDDKPYLAGEKVLWHGQEVEVLSHRWCGSIFSEDLDDYIYTVMFNGLQYEVHGSFVEKEIKAFEIEEDR